MFIPPQAQPVTGYFQEERFYANNAYTVKPITHNPPTQYPAVMDNEIALRNAPSLSVVSDNSMDPIRGRAAFAWVISGLDYVKRSKLIRTNPRYMSSFRSELEGVHDVILYLVSNHYTGQQIDYGAITNGALMHSPTLKMLWMNLGERKVH
jgi:hypothetical protein